MLDETEVNITRHKRKLETLREKDNSNAREPRVNGDRLDIEVASRSIQGTSGTDTGLHEVDGTRNEGTESGAGIAGRDGEGIRPTHTEGIDAVEGIDNDNRAPRSAELKVELTPEQKKERERELARQRKQRQRDRQKEQRDGFIPVSAVTNQSQKAADAEYSRSNSGSDQGQPYLQSVPKNVTPIDGTSRFTLKNPLSRQPEKVKLFTKAEAEEAKERLILIYTQGSALLDNLLEIIVKDHEKVTIWELDESEAEMLATAHLENAKKDEGAARSARALLGLYDKLFTIMLLGPRVVKTGQHVKAHGGFSFK